MTQELVNAVQKQELLIKLYEELVNEKPSTSKSTKIQKTKALIAKEELLKNNHEIKKILDAIRNV